MAYEQQDKRNDTVFSKKIRAGKKRTYFFDVKSTRSNDYYLTLTESLKHFEDNTYQRHKIFVYKEDLNKFSKALNEVIDHMKVELMPNFDFDAFNHEYPENGEFETTQNPIQATLIVDSIVNHNSNSIETVDKW